MKFAVSIYSFMQYIRAEKLSVTDCVAKAKEMGFDAIEIVDFVLGEDRTATAKAIREKADEVGIEISNFAVGADLLAEDGVEKAKTLVDIAEILGVSYMRHAVTSGNSLKSFEGYDNVVDRLATACREVTEYALQKNIRTMTENHGYFSQDSLRVEKLINTVAHENFGMLVDLGNFLCADDDPVTAVGRCAKYAFCVHAKDFIVKNGQTANPGEGFFVSRGGNFLRGTIIGHGDVPVLQCLRALKKAGFDGYVAVEFEGMEDCLNGIRIGFDNLKNYVSML